MATPQPDGVAHFITVSHEAKGFRARCKCGELRTRVVPSDQQAQAVGASHLSEVVMPWYTRAREESA